LTVAAGSRLGPYEVLSPLGAGGMGEVWKARDTRLERTVAVKVLPQHMSASPEVRQRFEREAKTISQLSHPHICALYDVGQEGETEYLVMEYLEGETLSDRLVKGTLPLEQTLRYGVEIADALDKAHRQGIVHRDLKPGNVMLTKSGVKLLDFGLAKVLPSPPGRGVGGEGLTSLPTQANLTQEGTILGTFQYMAPEQLEGKEADARTDIFAFGAVLYEMATGRKAFSGASQASLISAIMKEEPVPISTVQPTTPLTLDRVVRTCLAKDPEDRWQSAADIKRELSWVGEGSQAGMAAPVVARRRNRERLSWAMTAVVLVALVAAVAAAVRYANRAAALGRPMRSSIVLPEKTALRGIAISPDGRRLAFVARDPSGKNLLWIRPLDSLAALPLPGTENPSFPFWSPDSRFIGFFADGKLKKIDASGGPPQTLCDAPLSRGGTWNREGVILFSPVPDGPLYRVSASGGLPTRVTRFDPARGETSHRWPFFLPDGRRFLYLVASFGSGDEREKMGIYVGSLDSKEEVFLLPAKSTMAFAPSLAKASEGYLLFLRERNLLAQPFNVGSLRIIGDPFPVAEQIQYFPQTANALFSVSESGLLLYSAESAMVLSRLAWVDRSGRETGFLGTPGDQANPRISPDGKRVALDIIDHQTGNMDIWIYQSSGGVATRVTSDPAIDACPTWSPDGDRIAFMSIRKGHPDVYQRSSSGAGSEDSILQSERAKYTTDWSPDGRFILYRAIDATTNLELWALPVGGDRKPFPFIKKTFGVSHGQFSPDGRWVAYASNESGKWEIFVAPFPGPGGNWKVSSAGGSEPRWRRDGKELFYLAPDGKLMTVEVKAGPTFEAGAATPLFQTRRRVPVSATDLFSYDVSADGQRFLVNMDVGEVASSPLTVVLNWTAELKK
jgi:eukaryotic-like serine/threonine-protein kinase